MGDIVGLLRLARWVSISVCVLAVVADVTVAGCWIWRASDTVDIPYMAFSTPAGRDVLAQWGISIRWWVSILVFLNLAGLAVSVVAAYLIQRARPSWFGMYLAISLIFIATLGSDFVHVLAVWLPGLAGFTIYLQGAAWMAMFPVAYVFPSGTFVPKWSRWFAVAWVVYLPGSIIAGLTGAPGGDVIDPIIVLVLVGSCAFSQGYRYIKVSDLVARQQARWVAVAFTIWFVMALVLNISGLGKLYGSPTPAGLTAFIVISIATTATLALIPVAIAIAVARYRLFDLDPWISRALVYTILTAFVAFVYELVVGGLGNAVTADYSAVLAWLAGALVSILFGPIGDVARRLVNRLLYGKRTDPYTALSALARTLTQVRSPDQVASAVVATVTQALAVPYAAIAFGHKGPAVAHAGTEPDDTEYFALSHASETLGVLTVGWRKPGLPFSPADRRLLLAITSQSALALYAAHMAQRLQEDMQPRGSISA